jgi:hypothetical protein
MTFRLPTYIDGTQGIREHSTAHVALAQQEAAVQYGLSPTTTLSVIGSGGNLGTINDTRLISGTASQNVTGAWPAVTTYPNEATTGEPTAISVGYSRINQTVASVSVPATTGLPVYVDGTTGVREMTQQDFYDTFIATPLSEISNGTRTDGMYYIASGNTGLGIVFTDTRANTGAFTAAQIGTTGTTQDHATTVQNFSLVSRGATSASTTTQYPLPLYIDGTQGLIEYTWTAWESLLASYIRYYSTQSGTQISYNINGTGTNQGTGMTDTRLVGGSGTYTQYAASADDYRAQEFPDGTAQTVATYFLRSTLT